MKKIKFYEDAWFKVEYTKEETSIKFKAWKIIALDEVIEDSETEDNECLKGYIKWDECCEFEYAEHYCGEHHADQFRMLIKEIYAFNKQYNSLSL